MLQNEGSILMKTLTKMIRREVELELRQKFSEQLETCQSTVSWFIMSSLQVSDQ